MREYVDPFDYLEPDQIGENLEVAIEDPYSVNFRSNRPDKLNFPPEDELIRSATADFANNNVEVQFNPQSIEEKYVVLAYQQEIGIVESHTKVPVAKRRSEIQIAYHLLTPEANLRYDGQGYTEPLNNLPRQAACKAPELFEKAKELDELDSSSASNTRLSSQNESSGRSYVPPPKGRKDPL